MSDIWVFGVTTVVVLLVVIAVVWWWPDRIPRGRSVDEIRQRIEDEQDGEPRPSPQLDACRKAADDSENSYESSYLERVGRDVYRIVAPASEDVACCGRASVQEQ